MKEIVITSNDAQQRIDRFLKKYLPESSKGFIYKMIRKKRIKVNGKRVTPDYILKIDDNLQLYLGDETIHSFQGNQEIFLKKADLDIVYEDQNILLVNKPKNLLVHGDKKEVYNTLMNQVYYYLINKGEYNPKEEKTFSPSPCNRLDRNTSGIVIFAKNFPTLQSVNSMIKNDYIIKKYIALVRGKVEKDKELKGYLIKDEKTNSVQIISQAIRGAKFIHTIYHPLKTNGDYSLLEIHLITGRSHQIRAHLLQDGFPIIGDYKYGDKRVNSIFQERYNLRSQFLHAASIQFNNCPNFLSYLEGKNFKGDLPVEFKNILGQFGWGVQ